MTLRSGAARNGVMAAAAGEDNENKVNVIVNYVFEDGKIAANPWTATLPKGEAYTTATPITLPSIAGYAPSLGEGGNAANATLNSNQLTLSFSAEDTTRDCIITIVYQTAVVKVVVNYLWQNPQDDNYALHETVTYDATTKIQFKTGDKVKTELIDKTYEGFYVLLHEEVYAAADGSTVVNVKYDRYYYLMTFDLSGGYGMDAIYDRYGATIPLETMAEPTRPGYTLTGWTLDGRDTRIHATMPARNTTFVAVWAGEDTTYTVVFWYENADNSRYSMAGVRENISVQSGTVVNGADHKNYAFEGRDDTHFTYFRADENVTVDGNGSTVVNVYFKRNVYTVTYVMGGWANGCSVPIHASHTDYTGDCYTLSCDQYHVHTDGCDYVTICGETVHEHDSDCLICTKTIHPAHTLDECYVLNCEKTDHYHAVAGCTLQCNHTLACYGNPGTTDGVSSNDSKAIANIPNTDDPQSGYVYAIDVSYGWKTYYYFYFNGQWYDGDNVARGSVVGTGTYKGVTRTWTATKYEAVCNHAHDKDCYSCGQSEGTHYHTLEGGCYEKTCNLEIHAAHTEANGCYKDTAHVHTDECFTYTCGAVEHTHTEDCYKLTCDQLHYHQNSTCYLVISRKYDADLTDIWEKNPVKAVIEDGNAFKSSVTGDYYSFLEKIPGQNITLTASDDSGYKYTWYYCLEVLPGQDTTGLTLKESNGKTYYIYHSAFRNAGSGLGLTYAEDYFPITGFKQRDSNVPSFSSRTAYLYYIRNTYNLSFSNLGETVTGKGGDIYYQADISGQYFVPDYPDNLEPDAYRFDGWYTSPFFGDTKYDFTNATMPAEDIRLYANWVPVSRTVRFFLDKADMAAGVIIPERMEPLYVATQTSKPNSYSKFATKTDVPNRSFLNDVSAPGVSEGYDAHPYKGYTFVGWFYIEDGKEKAFDPANMPVVKDLDLYAKWSSNVLCPYEIYFALDEDGDGVPDVDNEGKITYVADPITGSTLAGDSQTFDAKGDTALYAAYQSGYFPNVASHSIDFMASDKDGVEFTFLYKSGDPVPYTVYYVTGQQNKENSLTPVVLNGKTYYAVADTKVDGNNLKAVVTENFVPVSGYMPDEYQKTLVVVPGGNNVIIFHYTVDTVHALYQINHYIQNLDGKTWSEYRSETITGDITKPYSTDAITITGFTYSASETTKYNVTQKINAYTGDTLPGAVTVSGSTVSGTLTGNGMQLNLYYTRNTHSYKVQYLEYGTNNPLADEKTVSGVYYNQNVTESAITIQKDMDGDGKYEDFQLYEPKDLSQSATITDNTKVFVFYYVRCTAESLSVTKVVEGNGADADQTFNFTLTSTATDFATVSNGSYAYKIKAGETVVDANYKHVDETSKAITFSLKAGQTITIEGLPTAVYTVAELTDDLPLGYYYKGIAPTQPVTLTKGAEETITVTNTYEPAQLEIKKIVNRVENVTDNVTAFEFEITVPDTATETYYSYTVGDTVRSADVENGIMTITLMDGETACFSNLPEGAYTVAEKDYTSEGYSAKYEETGDTDGTTTDGTATLHRGQKDIVTCTNAYPVGSLTITKTVKKAYANDVWEGDTFTFTVERTDGQLNSSSYPVYSGITKTDDADVNQDGKLVVTITFTGDIKGQVQKSIKIDNLPKGEYKVTETADADYTQDHVEVSTEISPKDYAGKAEFTNTYKKHLGDLTIIKTGWNSIDENQTFIFKVTGSNSFEITVTINGNGSVTIKDLMPGVYTVTEKTDWSWRYTPDGNDKTINLTTGPDNTVEFENTRSVFKWLSGDSFNENQYTVKPKTQG